MTESEELMEYEELCDQILARYRDSHGMVDTAIRELVRKSMLICIENERLRTTRPEPSRLEIAKDIFCATLSNAENVNECFEDTPDLVSLAYAAADALLAAAKGGE